MENDIVKKIKEKLSIVDVVSDYVEMKKTGSTYKALCPFHKEKTPSFVISPEKEICYCFWMSGRWRYIFFYPKDREYRF